jgi:hypothetical protein
LGWERKTGEDLGGTIGLENVVTAGPGNSCPPDFGIEGGLSFSLIAREKMNRKDVYLKENRS